MTEVIRLLNRHSKQNIYFIHQYYLLINLKVMAQENQNVNVVVTKSTKSVGIAIALGLFFGPLGMLYSTILGAFLMFIIDIIVGIVTLGIGLFITIPLGAIWAGIAAHLHNKKIMSGRL